MSKDGEEDMEAVLARAQAAVSELAKSYGTWAMADLDRCRDLLGAARADAVLRSSKLAELYGIAHNIKGQGTSFGYPLMTQIGQSLCIFTRPAHEQAGRAFDERELGVIQSHLDAMRLILTKEIRGDGGDTGRKLAQRLEAMVREVQG
jgi:hypothetical protein